MSYNKNCGKPDNTSVRFDPATGLYTIWDGFRFVSFKPAVPEVPFFAQFVHEVNFDTVNFGVGAINLVPFNNATTPPPAGDLREQSPVGAWQITTNPAPSQTGLVVVPVGGTYQLIYSVELNAATTQLVETYIVIGNNSPPTLPLTPLSGSAQEEVISVGGFRTLSGSIIITLEQGQCIGVNIRPSDATINVGLATLSINKIA